MKALKSNKELIWSAVVANNAMNRQRKATGINSYADEIGINVIDFLKERKGKEKVVRWLDICCGEGNSILEVCKQLPDLIQVGQLEIVGIDLVDFFNVQLKEEEVRLIVGDVIEYFPEHQYDLITCVHGLHYVGNKLKLIAKSLNNLCPGGNFYANMELGNIKGIELNRLKQELREAGLDYDGKRHILKLEHKKEGAIDFNYEYLGADDQAGKNYTGKEIVHSYYG